MVLMTSEEIPLGTKAPAFELEDAVTGETFTLERFEGSGAHVVMFLCNHCPYVQAVEDRLIALARELQPRGAAFIAIMPNDVARYPADGPEQMKARALAKAYPFPYLYDESQAVARTYGAVCTPDLFVYDAERRLAYRGRLDDNWKDAKGVTRRDLARAIEAVLAKEEPPGEQIPSMGCSIKWKA